MLLSFGQRSRQAKLMSLTSPGLASNAHSSTPRLSRMIGRGRRRRRRQHLDHDVLVLADRQLILDRDPDREVVAVAHGRLERALVGLRRRHDQAGRSFVALDDGAFDLDLVVGAETEFDRFILAGGGHLDRGRRRRRRDRSRSGRAAAVRLHLV